MIGRKRINNGRGFYRRFFLSRKKITIGIRINPIIGIVIRLPLFDL